jgi:hypothetical protein
LLESGARSIAELLDAKCELTGGILINGLEASNTSLKLTRAAYSEKNYQKLIGLKNKYDPTNVFRFNHNTLPNHSEIGPKTPVPSAKADTPARLG